MRLQDKVCIITGGAAGIGKATAVKFAAEGAKVVICDVNEEAGNALAEELGNDASFWKVNVVNRQEVQAWIDAVAAKYGRIDVLINNAGITRDSQFVKFKEGEVVGQMSEDAFDAVIAVNLKGVFLCSQAVIPQMMKQKQGRIINIGSTASIRMTFFGSVEYTVSKHGVGGLTQHLAWELADSHITVNTVCPGGVLTPLMEAGTTPEYREMTIKRLIPLGRFTTMEEIGEAVSFLASDRAATITGQMIAVDGGLLTGFGEDLRAVVRKRMADLKVAQEAKKH